MQFPLLLSAAIASVCISSAQASLTEDFQAYLAAHPGQHDVSTSDQTFVDWKATESTGQPVVDQVVPKAYIVQLQPGSGLTKRGEDAHAQFHKRASDINYSTRYEFNDPSLFFGLSIQVKDGSNATTLAKIPNVIAVWPVKRIPRPLAVGSPPTGVYNVDGENYTYTATASKSANVNAPHRMTEVDRLHDEGVKGKGIKIAIMDTGVDWRHPALGGCFGPDCKISFGKAFVGDDYGETGVAVQSPDPLATCVGGGHGTHVAGIIGMQDLPNSTFGLVGVAPEAEIGMYRVFGCSGSADSDIMILAFQQAVTDKVDILSLSLGSVEKWEENDPFANVTAGLEAAGIAVIVANGNTGGIAGTPSSPAIGKKVIGVGSVQNSHFPVVYGGKDSRGRSFKYSGSPWPVKAPATGLKVYDISKIAANSTSPLGCSDNAWEVAAAAIQDKENSIIIVSKVGSCSWGAKLNAAGIYGFNYSLAYAVAENDIFNQDYNTLEPDTISAITLNEVDGRTILGGLALSEDYRLYFPSDVFDSHTQITGGLVSNFSSQGPTSDTLALKPQLSAPGEAILATWPLEATGYAILSGTSMATPYLAGAFGLLKSQFPGATVQQLREILQGTAKSIPYTYDRSIRNSAAAQGSGLIDVYNAVHFESSVSPSELNLGDLDDLKPQEITIENKSTRTKTYIISHEPAGETNIIPVQYAVTYTANPPSRLGVFPSYATVSFSTTSITLKAGESGTFVATFNPPRDTPDKFLPVYSGFIKVKNNNDEFTVTYIGQPYSRAKADYIDTSDNPGLTVPILFSSLDFFTPIRDIGTFDFNLTSRGYPYLEWITLQSSRYWRLDLVPYNTTFVPDFYGFNRTESNPQGVPDSALPLVAPDLLLREPDAGLRSYGITKFMSADQQPSGYLWSVEPDLYDIAGNWVNTAVPGDYRLLLRVERWGGNPFEEEGYQSWLSPVVRLVNSA